MEKYRQFEDPSNGINPFIELFSKDNTYARKLIYMQAFLLFNNYQINIYIGINSHGMFFVNIQFIRSSPSHSSCVYYKQYKEENRGLE